jgi:hypothetical protein
VITSPPPLVEGATGWSPDGPCPFEAELRGPWREDRRHLPAAFRVFGREAVPNLTEHEAFVGIRRLTTGKMRRQVHLLRPTKNYRPEARKLLMWLFLHDDATAWWQSWWGWRSPREFNGWRAEEQRVQAPHLEPHEIAQLRLPEDVIMDRDVVVLHAWCQGVVARFLTQIPEIDVGAPVIPVLKSGLRKLHASPWIQMMLAAPHMAPLGVMFPSRGFSTSSLRMDAILRDPYSATDGELEVVLANYTFKVAYAKSAAARRLGSYMSPAGPWYADGNPHALGVNFHRGGHARSEVDDAEEA